MEDAIDGALWRLGQQADMQAWLLAGIMNVSGNLPKDGGAMTPERLLGRSRLALDPRYRPPVEESEVSEKREATRAYLDAHAERMRSRDRGPNTD